MIFKASNYEDNVVNQNDILQSVFINNAGALNLNANSFNVKLYLSDETTVDYSHATYDAKWDRLEFTNTDATKPVQLANKFDRIEFTKI
jgi:hypothetical protein